MAECVENKTGDPTDFDYVKEFENLGHSLIMLKLKKRALQTGFRTLDKRLVKAKSIATLGKPRDGVDSKFFIDKLCELIQTKGVCVATLMYNKKTSFIHNKNNILDRVYKMVKGNARKDVGSHAIAITGFDRQKELFTLTNSYGKLSHRYIKFEDLHSIFKSGMFIDDVIVTKK